MLATEFAAEAVNAREAARVVICGGVDGRSVEDFADGGLLSPRLVRRERASGDVAGDASSSQDWTREEMAATKERKAEEHVLPGACCVSSVSFAGVATASSLI